MRDEETGVDAAEMERQRAEATAYFRSLVDDEAFKPLRHALGEAMAGCYRDQGATTDMFMCAVGEVVAQLIDVACVDTVRDEAMSVARPPEERFRITGTMLECLMVRACQEARERRMARVDFDALRRPLDADPLTRTSH